MTSQWYVHDILQPHVLPLMQRFPGVIFQQNNARPHTARVSQDCLHTITTLPWPARSPNLSQIERIWDNLGRFVYPCSYTFFDHVREQIRQEFQFSEEVQLYARQVLEKANVHQFPNPTYVGIHVRRGDYEKRWLNIYKGLAVNMEFFQKAIEYFRNKYQSVIFLVVSDDRPWCIENLSGLLGVYVTEKASTPVHDLAVLAHCNHTVMTYGTYGFWGAYLAGGEVVYFDKFLKPNTSFINNNFIFDKMYPPRWKGIVTTNVSLIDW
ncbi:galactoside 2-alpha-L-fucosyltransferase 3 [Trichonephila clavipes]|nr:galactoside 2-alpha-L-fucosyltransferase 3 [Trichonephila clavipes]